MRVWWDQKRKLNEILKVQKSVLRVMLKLHFTDSVKTSFKELRILTVFGLYIYDTIIFSKTNNSNIRNPIPHKYNTIFKIK